MILLFFCVFFSFMCLFIYGKIIECLLCIKEVGFKGRKGGREKEKEKERNGFYSQRPYNVAEGHENK